MARLLGLLLCGVAAVSFSASAAQDDDGFVWLDANTKIRLKPISTLSGNAAAGSSAPEKKPVKEKKRETPKK